MAVANDPHWMEHASERMKEKGTVGFFGKATPKKIARAKKEGGKMEKKAIFAENAKKASGHKHLGGMKHSHDGKVHEHEGGHKAHSHGKEHEKKKAKKKERPLTYFGQHMEHD